MVIYKKTKTPQQGFTVIELMMAVAITSILLFGATVFGSYWINSSRLNITQSQMTEALNRAKSLGLRNINGVTTNQPAAFLTNQNGTLTLCTDEACSQVIWQTILPNGVSMTINGSNLTCIAFDNQGLPMNYSNCMNLNVGTQNYEITTNSMTAQGAL